VANITGASVAVRVYDAVVGVSAARFRELAFVRFRGTSKAFVRCLRAKSSGDSLAVMYRILASFRKGSEQSVHHAELGAQSCHCLFASLDLRIVPLD
jgi:hypothetical protein